MASKGTIRLSKLRDMLKVCLPDATIKSLGRNYWFRNGANEYLIPPGDHGDSDPEIQMGRIRALVARLGVDPACAKAQLGIQF